METENEESKDKTLPVGQRMKSWFTRDDSIAQNAVKWLQTMETRLKVVLTF